MLRQWFYTRQHECLSNADGQRRGTWVDVSGNYWAFVGATVDGDPSFGTSDAVDADKLFKRMVFSAITGEGFQWRWESSPTGGEWTVNWEIEYTRRS